MKRVFLDANVLWSAARKRDSLPWQLIWTAKAEFITSRYAIAEAKRNLPAESVPDLARLAARLAVVPDAFGPLPAGITLPGKDIPILATAAMADADLLVTGDSDFDALFGRTIGGVQIILPRDLAASL